MGTLTSRTRFPLLSLLLLAPAWIGAQEAGRSPVDENAPLTFSTFREIAREQMPSVVNITTNLRSDEGSEDYPLFRFFRQRPEHPEPPVRGMGSGLVVSEEGYILTNSHVVEEADSAEIALADGRNLEAQVVGRDPQLDLALLKVEADQPLRPALLGDSDALQIGDWVLAIGNPFGLSHSVSAGIVSALGRNIHTGPYDSYIQTDAAINRGNSGGPLFNIHGEVIGINTAILSPSGVSGGIGFAIPINQVKDVLRDLRVHGRVLRGWLGVGIRNLDDEEVSDASFPESGTYVTEVWGASPAAEAGIREGDVIVRFGEVEIPDTRTLLFEVASAPIGSTVPVELLRGGERHEVQVTIGERPDELAEVSGSSDPNSAVRPRGLGMLLQRIDEELRARFQLEEDSGVVVSEVEAESPAAEAGLEAGDVLLEINRTRIESPGQALELLQEAQSVLLLVRRGQKSLFLSLETGALESGPEVQEN